MQLDVYKAAYRQKPNWTLEFLHKGLPPVSIDVFILVLEKINYKNHLKTSILTGDNPLRIKDIAPHVRIVCFQDKFSRKSNRSVVFFKKPQVRFNDSKTQIKFFSISTPHEGDSYLELTDYTYNNDTLKTSGLSSKLSPTSLKDMQIKAQQEQFMMQIDAIIKNQNRNKLTKAFAAVISPSTLNSIETNYSKATINQFSQISHHLEDIEIPILADPSNICKGNSHDDFSSTEKARTYINVHKIYELFSFLGAHLVAAAPEEPIPFLISLLNECLAYRKNNSLTPPLLFSKKHIDRLYYSVDPMGFGFIGKYQYIKGMETLGIKNYDKAVILNDKLEIEKEFFINEAYTKLVSQFRDMINIYQGYCE